MRIALLGNAAALHTRRWARGLAAAGATVRVFSLEDPAADASFAAERGVEAPLDVVRLPAPDWPAALRYPAARAAAARALDAFAPDVIEAHFVPNYGLLGVLVGRGPLVVHAWGSDLLRSPARSALHAARARFVLARADLVVVDAEALAVAARALGAPSSRLVVAPWGADLARFTFGPAVLVPHVVSLRQLEPLYDVATLIEALPVVHAAVPELRVTIAGDGPEAAALAARAQARGVEGIVRFVGRVPHAALPALLASAAVTVSCALSDSTSIALLEGMAAGATPIVTDLPGNRAWVEDRVHGRLVPPGDAPHLAGALIETLLDPEFRGAARMAARGRIEERGDFAAVTRAALERHAGLATRGVAA